MIKHELKASAFETAFDPSKHFYMTNALPQWDVF